MITHSLARGMASIAADIGMPGSAGPGRLNGQFHKSVWPGELGLDNVTGVTRKIYWGTYGPGSEGGGIGKGGGGSAGAGGGGTGGFLNNSLVAV